MLKFIALLWALWRYNTKNALFAYIRKNVFPQSDKYDSFIKVYEQSEMDFRETFRQSDALYITHLHAVTVILVVHLKIRDMDEILAALLHDATEELPTIWTHDRISREYGSILAQYVVALTKPLFGPYDTYHQSFMELDLAIARIKLSDRIHNVLTLFYCSVEKQQRKIAETIEHYLPLSIGRDVLYPELFFAIKFARCMTSIASVWQISMLKTKPRAV